MSIKASTWLALATLGVTGIGLIAYSKRAKAGVKDKPPPKSPVKPGRPDPIDVQPNEPPPPARPDPIDIQPDEPEPWRAEYEGADIGSQTLFVAALSFIDPLSVTFAADTLAYRGYPMMSEALRERLKVLENGS